MSDPHFGHENIIKYCNRPFSNVKEMDETIINNINNRVAETDTLFVIGDFCMKRSSEASNAPQNAFDYYRNQIKCKNIIFLRGNHDKNNGTKTIIQSLIIEHGGIRIFFIHDPKYSEENYRFNFCGHVHDKYKFRKLGKKSIIVNLSVEQWNYQPVDINEVLGAYSTWLKSGKTNA
jgi:calcineurin-like phosphoesterase family protein